MHLKQKVDGLPEMFSSGTWVIDLSSGRISFSFKGAGYVQIMDYGRVLLNSEIEATGTVRRAASLQDGVTISTPE